MSGGEILSLIVVVLLVVSDILTCFRVVDLEADVRELNRQVRSLKPEKTVDGNTSDGYHTFNELYYHRCVLFSVICNQNAEIAWKSKQHHDGSMYNGMFIVGIETPYGQCTYHYDLEHWDLFGVKELEQAPVWDGHTPDDVLKRLSAWGKKEQFKAKMERYVAAKMELERRKREREEHEAEK
jgi:hypothetical protein